MTLTAVDRELLDRCLARKPRSWEDFVDRFIGLVHHAVDQTSKTRSLEVTPEDREDVIAEVFYALIQDDFAALRRFRGESSLATYLTVVTRRIAVKDLLKRRTHHRTSGASHGAADAASAADVASGSSRRVEKQKEEREQVQRLLQTLDGIEADLVRMRYLDGMSYGEIQAASGLPANSIGPTLSRAKAKLRKVGKK